MNYYFQYFSLFPLRTLRYIIGIANRLGEKQNVTDTVIIEISNWLKKYVAKEDNRTQIVNVMNKFYSDFKYIDEVRSHNPGRPDKCWNMG